MESTINWKNLQFYVMCVLVTVSLCAVDFASALANNQNEINVSQATIRCEDDPLEESAHTHKHASTSGKQLTVSPLRLCARYRINIVLKLTNDEGKSSNEGVIIRVGQATEPSLGNEVSFGQPLLIKIQQGPVFQVYPLHYAFTVNAKAYEETHTGDKLPHEIENDCQNFDKHSPCGTESDVSGLELGYCCPKTQGQDKNSNSPTVHCYSRSDYWYGVHELGPPQLFHQVYLQMYRLVENADSAPELVKLGGHGHEYIDSLTLPSFQEDIPNGDENDVLTVSYAHDKNRTALIRKPYLDSASEVLLLPIPSPSHFEHTPKDTKEEAKTHNSIPVPLRSSSIADSTLVVPRTLAGDHDGDVCDKIGVGPVAFLQQPDRCNPARKEGTCLLNQPFDLWDQDQDSQLRRIVRSAHQSTATPHKKADANRKHKHKHKHKPRKPRHKHQHQAQSTHYRLRNFGPVHKSAPIKMIGNTLHLTMENDHEPTTSFLDIELLTTSLEPIQPDYAGPMILSVITDSKAEHGRLLVQVANNAHASGSYRVQAYDCPPLVPNKPGHSGHLRSKLKTIHAQRVGEFKFTVSYGHKGRSKLVERLWCTLVVQNRHGEAIAMRQILLAPSDTCICYLNCECSCAKDSLRCRRLSKKDCIAAGIDDPAILAEADSESGLEPLLRSAKAYPELTAVITILLLILFGFCKGVLSLCVKLCCCGCECAERNWIGKLGLGFFYNRPRQLAKYYEKQYSNIAVVHVQGMPVDPITRKPTVERLSQGELIAYNTILFVAWPLILFVLCTRRCCPTLGDNSDCDRDQNRRRQGRTSYTPLTRQYSSDDLIEMDPMTHFKKEKQKQKPTAHLPNDESSRMRKENDFEVEVEIDTDGDEEIVHYSRSVSRSTSQGPSNDRDRDRRISYQDRDGAEEYRQYGLSFFMSEDGLGSGSGRTGSFAGRKDSNMSMTHVREDKSTEHMYRRTSAGQQEYAARLGVGVGGSRVQEPGIDSNSNSNSNAPPSRYGSWHRQPSDWSVRGSLENLVSKKADRA